MSDDGADLGMTAEDGMRGAIGDESVNEEATRRTPAELLAEIQADQENPPKSGFSLQRYDGHVHSDAEAPTEAGASLPPTEADGGATWES